MEDEDLILLDEEDSMLLDEVEDTISVSVTPDGNVEKRKRKGLLGRLFRRRKQAKIEEILMEDSANATELLADTVEEDILDLPPVIDSPRSPQDRPLMLTAGVPLALVMVLLLARAAWYFFEHHKKVEEEAEVSSRSVHSHGKSISNGHGSGNSHAIPEVRKPAMSAEDEQRLKQAVEREAASKNNLASENKTLQEALHMHKSSVDKFNMELQARNERLSVFEQEQEAVRKQLSSQIENLKTELQERQKQEQGNLKSKESLCNDLITKIKALNRDLENHEKLWQGVAKKAEQKEVESAVKVETLQKSLTADEQQRMAELQSKEKALADLTAKVKTLEAQHAHRATQVAACEQQMGSGIFPKVEEKLQAQLKTEQEYASSLSTKLQVFGAELRSREERVSNLDAKMKEVERLSTSELKKLQEELDGQVVQRKKLEQAAVEMTRLLQEKQTQCTRLKTQWESSKAELQTLNDKVQALTKDVSKREKLATSRIEAMEKQLDEERNAHRICKHDAEAANEELVKKQEEFVQLTTRMDLFLKELQFRDEQVASLESKLQIQEELATTEIKDMQSQLQELTERRDTWNKSTDEVNQLLKDKKAQVVGLTTRAELFDRELKNRQEGVETLEAKIKERQEEEDTKMEPYRKELRRLEEERDSWREKTDEIGRLLRAKVDQSEGLVTRLRLFRVELSKRDEQLSKLKKSYEDKRQSTQLDMAPVREKFERLRQQTDSWRTKTQDIDQTLKDKQAQCVGLKTRVLLFGRELETKEQTVSELEVIVADKEEAGNSIIERLKKKLNEQVNGRDEWKVSTDKVIQLLADRKNEAASLTTELKGLVSELQSYQQRRAKLDCQLVEQRELFGGRREAMEQELRTAQEHCDSWAEKTKEVTQSMTATEQSIVGLETRVLLFGKELASREEVVGKLRKEYGPIERKSAMKIEQLRGAIMAEKKLHEHGVDTTVKLNKELKHIKRECVGLATRLELFTRELKKRQDAVEEKKRKINGLECEASAVLERLRNAKQEQERLRDEWGEKTKEVENLQAENDERIVGLDTRLQLFMVEVMKAEENVSRAIDRRAPRGDIDAAKAKRDEWTARALGIRKELKERNAQVPGLKTRTSLFRVELQKRNKQVTELQLRIASKEKITAENVAPHTEALKELELQRDQWTSNLEGIRKTLEERQRQCLPVSKRLEEVIDQLTQCKERSDVLEEQLREETVFYETDVHALKTRFEQQKNGLSDWKKNTAKVKQLLQEKKGGVEGLKTRLLVFGDELRKRKEAVERVRTKIEDNDKSLAHQLESISFQIQAEHQERDRIIERTMAKNHDLKAIEETCTAVTVRRKLFEDELRNREEQATLLEARHTEKLYHHSAEMKRLKNALSSKISDRDKWKESTQAMEKLLKDTEQECVGLATRSQLFHIETKKYESQLADLEEAIARREATSAEDIAPLQEKLQQEQQARDEWDKKTLELDDMVQDNRREVVGLNTRSQLFAKELKAKEEVVATLGAKVKAKDDDFAERIRPLVQEYNTLKADRDQWEKSTIDVKKMLERTEAECASIPTRLDLFQREQQTRNNAVAELQAGLSNKEDIVAVQMGFLLNELQLQQKQRGKWKKVTLEMHRLLKETKDQVEILTEKLESCNSQAQKHEDKINAMTTALRDGRDMVANQLGVLRKEIQRQTEKRDKLDESTAELKDLLEKAMEQCKDLTAKLADSKAQVQNCTAAVESLETKVAEKRSLDASQMESIKGQLNIHLKQRAEWRENTDQMKQKLKEKQILCTGLKTKLSLLKNLQNGDVRSSLSNNESDAVAVNTSGGIAAHLEKINQMTSNIGRKTDAEVNLTAKMDSLEKELRKQQADEAKLAESTKHMEQGLKQKELQFADIAGKLNSMQKEVASSDMDVERMLAEKEKKQSTLNSRLESLTGELLNL